MFDFGMQSYYRIGALGKKRKADYRSRFERASAVSFFVIIKPYINHERYEGIKMAVSLYRQYGILFLHQPPSKMKRLSVWSRIWIIICKKNKNLFRLYK